MKVMLSSARLNVSGLAVERHALEVAVRGHGLNEYDEAIC
jgi:hypothetical protein